MIPLLALFAFAFYNLIILVLIVLSIRRFNSRNKTKRPKLKVYTGGKDV